jgi:urea transport system substrate-binding protein
VAEGLATAHADGLVHRDIKPANIWLESPTGRVKLLDFGLARAAGSRSGLTETGIIVGTPEFMSPEQARGEELDARSDLFSLGSVLYTLCTGREPFQGPTTMAVLTALAVDKPPRASDLNPEVSRELSDLIETLLAKAPADRPASAREVQDQLDAMKAGSARPTHTGFRAPTEVALKPASSSALSGAPRPLWRRPAIAAAAGILALSLSAALWYFRSSDAASVHPVAPTGSPIRIGVLHSRTGTMAISERPVIDAILFAVHEINEHGGLLGRPVEAFLADGQSDEAVFARQADKLIREDRVCTIFGCWTSASRKAVVPVIEQHDHLLFYSVQYEGAEQCPNVVYLGPVPNQQILPALRWAIGFVGRRWYLVGSDYVFPATANAVIRDEAKARGCEIAGEDYFLLGSADVTAVVKKIAEVRPDLIVNTINGDTNVAFFRALRLAGVTSQVTPTLSFSISEQELTALGPLATKGDYVAANYFQSLDKPKNLEFVDRFMHYYAADRVISSSMESAYAAVHLWAKAVEAAGKDDPRAIREAIKGQTHDAPQGHVRIHPATLHTVQIARVARVDDEGRLMEIYDSGQPIEPEPFPSSRSRAEWLNFLESLHKRWGGRWSNPGP